MPRPIRSLDAPVGLDGATTFVEMARRVAGCEVRHQDFLALDLPPGSFHGVFANASLVHVPSQELPRVLGEAGFEELESYYRPTGLPRERQPWFASVWRRGERCPSSRIAR